MLQVVPMADITKELDGTQEAADFLLAMLADSAPQHVTVLGSTMPSFKVSFYKQTAAELAEKEPVIAALVATGRERLGVLSGKMQAVAHASGLPPDAVQHALQRLAAKGQVHLDGAREPAVALRLRGTLAELPVTARDLHARLTRLMQSTVRPCACRYRLQLHHGCSHDGEMPAEESSHAACRWASWRRRSRCSPLPPSCQATSGRTSCSAASATPSRRLPLEKRPASRALRRRSPAPSCRSTRHLAA